MKKQIDNLRTYAELSMASYGYWHLIGKKFANKAQYKDRKNTEITMSDILDVAYNGYVSFEHIAFINTEKLDGEMTPLQIQAFIKRYKIKFHQSSTASGFSATLFHDIQKDRFVLGFI